MYVAQETHKSKKVELQYYEYIKSKQLTWHHKKQVEDAALWLQNKSAWAAILHTQNSLFSVALQIHK